MKIIITLVITVICGIGVQAQNGSVPQNINIDKPLIILPDTARYQIVTLPSTLGFVFKLDRYTGKTYEYNPGRMRWYLINVRGGLPAASSPTAAPRYLIYDMIGAFPLLINSETGQTWVLSSRTWEPIAD